MKFEIDYLAKLVRINLSKDEEKKFTSELEEILNFIAQLSEVDTKNTEPVAHVTGLSDVKRDDKVETEWSEQIKEKLLAEAPEREGDYVKVKPVFKK